MNVTAQKDKAIVHVNKTDADGLTKHIIEMGGGAEIKVTFLRSNKDESQIG